MMVSSLFGASVVFTAMRMFLEDNVIPPTRWLFSILMPMMLMAYALKKKSVCKSGAFLGIIVAFILSIANHAFFACLVVFFFSSSKATKFRSQIKKKFEKDFKEGEGQRNWIQVFCNGGVATLLAILYLIDCGSGEKPINFTNFYRSSWLGLGVMSMFFLPFSFFLNIFKFLIFNFKIK